MASDNPKGLWRSVALAFFGLVAAGISIFVYALAQRDDANVAGDRVEKTETTSATESNEFLQGTEAELQLENMLRDEGDKIDLALANWLIAADVPQFQDMPRAHYFAALNAITEQVRRNMEMMKPVVKSRGGDPDTPHARCSIFCGAMIRLKFDYREEFQRGNLTPSEMAALYGDANNLFLAGLLRSGRGSCVSMPLIYLVIGRRLGLPVHLVAVGKHYFIRWEEPGYRMNIETTIVEKVAMTPDDSTFLQVEGMGKDQVKGSELRNLTNREVVGQLFFTREGYWAAQGPEHVKERLSDLARAHHLAPDDPAIAGLYAKIFNSIDTRDKATSNHVGSNQQKGI